MMTNDTQKQLDALLINEGQLMSLAELCRGCALPAERVITMIEYGIVEPVMPAKNSTDWKFKVECVPRIRAAKRLQRDLDINLAGAAVALELMDELRVLRQIISVLQR